MLFMIRYAFQPGPNAATSLKRFSQWTPPVGFVPLNVWMATSHSGFLLGEAESAGAVLEVTAQYSDLASFQVDAVVDSSDGVPLLQRGFDYGSSH